MPPGAKKNGPQSPFFYAVFFRPVRTSPGYFLPFPEKQEIPDL